MRLIILLLLIIFSRVTFGQSYTIQGEVRDTFGEPLISTSVMVLDKDSLLLAFTTTDLQGKFEVSGVKKSAILLKISYLGYVPRTLTFTLSQANTNVGTVYLKEMANELIQVVIKEAKAPIRLRGDTVEYDISQFKVPEGSTLEAILRKLPGISVNPDGSVEADGQSVRKLTIDGKTFFSEDPGFAMKTLPSEAVSKVQVFTHKDEEAIMTGKTSPQNEKAMNVELKEEYKKIQFGKMIVGAGTESRGELKGNYNKFNKNDQFSIIALSHNTTKNGFSWDDQSDFYGKGLKQYYTSYEYGFGSLGAEALSPLENRVASGINLQSGVGFPYSNFGGVNYNYEKGKHKLSSRYIIHQNGLNIQSFTNQRTFVTDFPFDNKKEKEDTNHANNQKAEILWEYKIDSLNTIKANIDIGIINIKDHNVGEQDLIELTDNRRSQNIFSNTAKTNGYGLNSALLWWKKFRKEGRGLAANAWFYRVRGSEIQNLSSENIFFLPGNIFDSSSLLAQENRDSLLKNQYRANITFYDQLNSAVDYSFFYNMSFRDENNNRLTKDQVNGLLVLNDSLSRFLDYSSFNHRAGLSLGYILAESINFNGGMALQEIKLNGDYRDLRSNGLKGNVSKSYKNFIPNFSMDAQFTKKFRVSLFYEQQIKEPEITNLFPIVDLRNPLYIVEGNPDLSPVNVHEGDIRFVLTNPLKGSRVSVSGFYNYYENQIIFSQTVDSNLVTYARPLNYSGATERGMRLNTGFRIWKEKINIRLNGSVNFINDFTYVNDLLVATDSRRTNGNLQLNFSPSDRLSIDLSSEIQFTDTRFDGNEFLQQEIWRQNHNLNTNFVIRKHWFFGFQGRLSILQNKKFGINQQIPILNLSAARRFFKNNKAEIRLTLYDALNRNLVVSQTTTAFQVVESRTQTLARYVMLTFSYNIRGISSKINQPVF